MINDILTSRENRRLQIEDFANQGNVVCIKANIPGSNKCISESYLLVKHFSSYFQDVPIYFDSSDGPYALLISDSNLKEMAIRIEETHELGRLVDIDVYLQNSSKSISRGYMRKCLLCDKPAFVCSRSGAHSTEQLLDMVKSKTCNYFTQVVSDAIKFGLMTELNLDNKFGLVTPTSNGSHVDLSYELMQKAQDAIVPYLCEMFFEGLYCDDISHLLTDIRKIGLDAENAMDCVTEGTNAYKGLIFVAGVTLASMGFTTKTLGKFDDVFDNIKVICKDILNDFDIFNNTFGCYAYRNYGITGVRGHAREGFCQVKKVSQMLTDFSDKKLMKALQDTVNNIQDTVLLKRCGNMDKYKYFQQLIVDANTDSTDLKNLTDICIKNNVSIGGSADVLATGVMVRQLCKTLSFHIN